jgi:hypothetical protein
LAAARGHHARFAAALAPGVGTIRFYDEREPDRGRVLDELGAWVDGRLSPG